MVTVRSRIHLAHEAYNAERIDPASAEIMRDDEDEDMPLSDESLPSAETAEIPTQAGSPSPEAEKAATTPKSKPRTPTSSSA